MRGDIYFCDTKPGVYAPQRKVGCVSSAAQNGEQKYIYI